MTNPTALVSKLWNYCSILRDDGLPYGDYVEQLTFLLLAPFRSGFAHRFALPVSAALRLLKMADEQSRLRGMPSAIPVTGQELAVPCSPRMATIS